MPLTSIIWLTIVVIEMSTVLFHIIHIVGL